MKADQYDFPPAKIIPYKILGTSYHVLKINDDDDNILVIIECAEGIFYNTFDKYDLIITFNPMKYKNISDIIDSWGVLYCRIRLHTTYYIQINNLITIPFFKTTQEELIEKLI